MATNTYSGTGLASDITKWSLGRVPTFASADKIVVAAGADMTFDTGHAGGVYQWGDDSTTAITINGTIRFPHNQSITFQQRGGFITATGSAVYFGSEANPVDAAVTHTWVANDRTTPLSQSAAAFSFCVTNGRVEIWGAPKTVSASITDIVSQSVFTVSDATGWCVNDTLVFAPTSSEAATTSTVEARRISDILLLSGVTARITLEAGAANTHYAGREIINVTRNVRFIPAGASTIVAAPLIFSGTASTPENSAVMRYFETVGTGGGIAISAGAVIRPHFGSSVREIRGGSHHDILAVSGASVTTIVANARACLMLGSAQAGALAEFTVIDAVVAQLRAGVANGVGVRFTLSNCAMESPRAFGAKYPFSTISASPNYTTKVSNPTIRGCRLLLTENTAALGFEIFGGKVSHWERLHSADLPAVGLGFAIDGVDFSSSGNYSFPTDALTFQAAQSVGMTFRNCKLPAAEFISINSAINTASAASYIRAVSINEDPTINREWTYAGQIARDNDLRLNGTSSVRLDCWYTGVPATHTLSVSVQGGGTLRIKGAMRYSTQYSAATPPRVSVSAPGISEVSAVCPTTGADTWHPYELLISNTGSSTAKFTVTYTAQSTGNAVGTYVWFDGVYDAADILWVDSVRHFGYQFLAATSLVPDPRITLTEAQALALPALVDHTAQTITVTGALTPRQVFEACIADLAQTANQGRAVHITSATGETFATSYAVIGTITGPYTDAAGLHVTISAPNLIAQTRVQLWDVVAGTEIHNAQMTANGFSLPLIWTADRTIRLRAGYAEGAVAKLPIEAVGVLTSSGLTFLDAQVDDAVYNAIGLDGGLMSEFAPDYPNLAINVTDPDGVTSVQRLYAWAAWSQTSELGIRLMFRAVQASDTANFQIDQSLVDAKLKNANATPVMMVGGYLTRKDGSTVIAANSGSIQMDPGKAYVAAGSGGSGASAADVWAYASRTLTNGQLLLGSGERVLTLADGRFVARG